MGLLKYLIFSLSFPFFDRLLQTIGAPMALRRFPSGACVLQLNTNRDEEIARVTSDMVSFVSTL